MPIIPSTLGTERTWKLSTNQMPFFSPFVEFAAVCRSVPASRPLSLLNSFGAISGDAQDTGREDAPLIPCFSSFPSSLPPLPSGEAQRERDRDLEAFLGLGEGVVGLEGLSQEANFEGSGGRGSVPVRMSRDDDRRDRLVALLSSSLASSLECNEWAWMGSLLLLHNFFTLIFRICYQCSDLFGTWKKWKYKCFGLFFNSPINITPPPAP